MNITVKAEETDTYELELSYTVGNCGWIPSYDVKAQRLDSPLSIVYYASVFQSTGIDWENVE